MEDDFDLEGLSREEARRYVTGFIQSLQLTRRDRAGKEAEYEKWKARTKLAADRGETELAKEALRRAEEAHARLGSLRTEERNLEFKVTELKRRLTNLEKAPELTVDAEALLDRLQSVTDPDQETNESLAEAEAELALEELRRRMNEQSEGDG